MNLCNYQHRGNKAIDASVSRPLRWRMPPTRYETFGKPIPEKNGSFTRDSTSCLLQHSSPHQDSRPPVAQSMTRAMIEKCTTGLGGFASDLHTESYLPEAASIAQRKYRGSPRGRGITWWLYVINARDSDFPIRHKQGKLKCPTPTERNDGISRGSLII